MYGKSSPSSPPALSTWTRRTGVGGGPRKGRLIRLVGMAALVVKKASGKVQCVGSDLGAHEEYLLEREVRWYQMQGEEDYPNFVSIEFECTSSERYMCGCDLTGHLGECVEVKVFVFLDENYVKD